MKLNQKRNNRPHQIAGLLFTLSFGIIGMGVGVALGGHFGPNSDWVFYGMGLGGLLFATPVYYWFFGKKR